MGAETNTQKIYLLSLSIISLLQFVFQTHNSHSNLLDCCMMVVLEAGSRCLKVDKVQFSCANGERFTLICLVYLGKPQRMSLICLVFSGLVSAPEP